MGVSLRETCDMAGMARSVTGERRDSGTPVPVGYGLNEREVLGMDVRFSRFEISRRCEQFFSLYNAAQGRAGHVQGEDHAFAHRGEEL